MEKTDDINKDKKESKQVKNGMLIIIILAFMSLIAIGSVYYVIELGKKKYEVQPLYQGPNDEFIESGVPDYDTIYYVSKKDDYENSMFKHLKYDNDYVIISTYSDYKKICKKIKKSPYEVELDLNITKEFFENNSLLIIDNYSRSDIKHQTYLNDIKNSNVEKITVEYLNSGCWAGPKIGEGSLTFIQFNSKIKKDTVVKIFFKGAEIPKFPSLENYSKINKWNDS